MANLRRTIRMLAAALASVWLFACANNVGPSAAQFGQSVTTTVSAENALFDAVEAKQKSDYDMNLLQARKVTLAADGTLRAAGDTAPHNPVIDPAVRKAIGTVLSSLQAYGQALTSLAGDTAGTTFDTNVDSLAKALTAVDASVLTPLGGRGLPSSTQVTDVAEAVKDIGNAVIAMLIARNVQSAARSVQQPLTTIADGLKAINGYWTKDIPAHISNDITYEVVGMWNSSPRSISDHVTLKAIADAAAIPVTPTSANAALDTLLQANAQIIAAGPQGASAAIQAAIKAANDALTAFSGQTGKK